MPHLFPMNVRPRFDIALFSRTFGEALADAETLDFLLARWREWSALTSCETVEDNGKTYLAVWLAPEVEKTVSSAWARSPSAGFMLNALAQTLCTCAVREILPETEKNGCAPVPPPSPSLAAGLAKAGLPARAGTGLELGRVFAVVTPNSPGESCGTCALASSCPRAGNPTGGIKKP